MRSKYLTYTISHTIYTEAFGSQGYSLSVHTWDLRKINWRKHIETCLFPGCTTRCADTLYVNLSNDPESQVINRFLTIGSNLDLFKPFPFITRRKENNIAI